MYFHQYLHEECTCNFILLCQVGKGKREKSCARWAVTCTRRHATACVIAHIAAKLQQNEAIILAYVFDILNCILGEFSQPTRAKALHISICIISLRGHLVVIYVKGSWLLVQLVCVQCNLQHSVYSRLMDGPSAHKADEHSNVISHSKRRHQYRLNLPTYMKTAIVMDEVMYTTMRKTMIEQERRWPYVCLCFTSGLLFSSID